MSLLIRNLFIFAQISLQIHKSLARPKLASNPRRLKYGLVFIAWVLVHMRDTITQNLGNPYYDHKTL